jgi:chromosome partitioning protein
MQIAVIAKKGGVGKTTLCILLHEAIRQTGQRVAIRDFDAQGSATKALKRFGGTAEIPGEKYDVLLIDSPPSLTMSVTAAAVSAANIILIPTSPSPADVWEAGETAGFAQAKNSNAIVRLVLNRTRSGTLLTEAAPASLKDVSAAVLTASIADRQSYQHALLTEVPQLSQHALAFKRLCEQIQAIFSTTFWMIFGDVGSAKPRCASSWATGLSGRATRRRRSWPRFLTGRITSMERMVETSNRS